MVVQFRKGRKIDKCMFCAKSRHYVVYDLSNESRVACIPCLKSNGDNYGIMLSKWKHEVLEKVIILYKEIVGVYKSQGLRPPLSFKDVIPMFERDYVPVEHNGEQDNITFTWASEGEVLQVLYKRNYKDSQGFVVGTTLDILMDYYKKQIFIDGYR